MTFNRFVVFTLMLVAASGLALAGTATHNLSVTADVSNNCTITTSALSFGAYDPIVANASEAKDGTGTVSTTCTTGASVKITLDQGAKPDTGSTDTLPLRRMISGESNYLSYALWQDIDRSNIWANTSDTGVSDTGTGGISSKTVYGRIPAGQNVPAGSYTDTVVATVTFI